MDIENGLYKHYKGNAYMVLMTARHSETEELMVIYKAMYGHEDMWVRPYEMFMEKVEVEGVRVPRFEKID